jgi:hypothetical protein
LDVLFPFVPLYFPAALVWSVVRRDRIDITHMWLVNCKLEIRSSAASETICAQKQQRFRLLILFLSPSIDWLDRFNVRVR